MPCNRSARDLQTKTDPASIVIQPDDCLAIHRLLRDCFKLVRGTEKPSVNTLVRTVALFPATTHDRSIFCVSAAKSFFQMGTFLSKIGPKRQLPPRFTCQTRVSRERSRAIRRRLFVSQPTPTRCREHAAPAGPMKLVTFSGRLSKDVRGGSIRRRRAFQSS